MTSARKDFDVDCRISNDTLKPDGLMSRTSVNFWSSDEGWPAMQVKVRYVLSLEELDIALSILRHKH